MLRGLIGEGSVVSALRAGLGDSTRRIGEIAHRVANASTPGFEDIAALQRDPSAVPAPEPVDLEREMVALADEHLRFDAAARLLRMNYDAIRLSLRQG